MPSSSDNYEPSRFARFKLFRHVLEKGWQTGSIIGIALVAPALAFRAKSTSKSFLHALKDPELVIKAAAYGAVGGATFSGAVGAAKLVGITQHGVEERVYKLHYNQGQQRTDTFCEVGMALGAAAAAYFLGVGVPLNVVGGAAVGSAGGLLLHLATRPVDSTPNKMLHELRH